MQLIILAALLAGTFAAPMQQSLSVNDDGTYQFFYETGKEAGNHKRTEVRHPDGVVEGKFSYEDPNGDLREVSYRADDSGYVANGDVSVEGAPKGQFPAPLEPEHPAESLNTDELDTRPPAPEDDPEDPKEEHKSEDIKELTADEPSPDDPPEAFPQGYFLQQFQGLRRLPEVTSAEEVAPTEVSSTEKTGDEAGVAEEADKGAEEAPELGVAAPQDAHALAVKSAHDMFMHLRPFQGFSAQQVAPSMFHQPVYVYSYQHPDSYGYHYYF